MLNIYIANLGKYNEGFLVGSWVALPATEDEINYALVKAGLGYYDKDNGGAYVHGLKEGFEIYEEYAIHDFETDIEGFEISEYSSIERLNEIAEGLDLLDDHEAKKAAAIFEAGFCSDLLECIDRVEEFTLYEDITNDRELGEYWVYDSGCYDIPDNIKMYIDCEAFGRDIAINSDAAYTSYGYLERS